MEYRQALAAGTLLASEYRISATLRQDGFCITYDAEDLQLKQHVLIKEYFPAEIADRVRLSTVRPKSTRQVGLLSWGRQRFIEEAQTLTKFGHPGIARVKRVFEENNAAYAVVDAEDWPTLLSWADKQRRQLSQNELDEVAKQLLTSLELLHDANVLVRDLSPESIFIRDKRLLVLVDFGTAKSQLAARARKMHAAVRPGYSAPEQYLFDDAQQGPWTDIFSLGSVLYRLFTGRSPVEVIHRHHSDEMAKAAALHTKGYRLEFLQAIDRAMALAPADRPQTAKAFRALLLEPSKAAVAPVKPSAPPEAPTQSPSQAAPSDLDASLGGSLAPRQALSPSATTPVSEPESPPPPQTASLPAPAAPQPAAGSAGGDAAPRGGLPAEGSPRQPPAAPSAPAPATPRIPASMVPSALLSDKAADEDRLGFALPQAEPEEPEEPKTTEAAKPAAKESPVRTDPNRPTEIEALAVSNRRFMIAVVGIIGALIGIIGLGLITLERTLRQPAVQQEAALNPARQTEQDRAKAEQKALFEVNERKRQEAERAAERRAAEAQQKRATEEAAERKRRDEEASRIRQAEKAAEKRRLADAEKQIADEAERKRRDDEAAKQKQAAAEAAERKRKDEETARQKQAEDARQKQAAEAAERKRQDEEAARQKQIAEEAERKRRDEETARQQRVAEEAAERRRRDEEAAKEKQAEDARQKQIASEIAEQKRRDEAQSRKRLADEEASKQIANSEQRRLAEDAMKRRQLAEEAERRRQEEVQRIELRRLAEEAERRRSDQAKREAQERLSSDQKRQAEEAARIAQRQRSDVERQLANQISGETSREALLKIAAQTPAWRETVERRLVELGFLRVSAGVGEVWRKPGGGEVFQDCPSCPPVVVVPAGQFLMGSPASEIGRQDDEDDTPGPGGSQVRVAIPRPFAVTRFEITRGQFAAFVAETKYKIENGCFVRVDAFELFPDLSWQSPGFQQGEDHPAACVSWLDAQAYAAWLSKKTGHTYRLLTEAEWEYAARGAPGATVQPRFPFGGSDKDLCAFGNGADMAARKIYPRWQVAGCNDGYGHTAPAGSFEPNATGLHDMLGNLWEWVEDCYRESYKGQPATIRKPGAAPEASCAQDLRVLRGGSWSDQPEKLRPAARIAIPSDKRIQIGGFRLAREL